MRIPAVAILLVISAAAVVVDGFSFVPHHSQQGRIIHSYNPSTKMMVTKFAFVSTTKLLSKQGDEISSHTTTSGGDGTVVIAPSGQDPTTTKTKELLISPDFKGDYFGNKEKEEQQQQHLKNDDDDHSVLIDSEAKKWIVDQIQNVGYDDEDNTSSELIQAIKTHLKDGIISIDGMGISICKSAPRDNDVLLMEVIRASQDEAFLEYLCELYNDSKPKYSVQHILEKVSENPSIDTPYLRKLKVMSENEDAVKSTYFMTSSNVFADASSIPTSVYLERKPVDDDDDNMKTFIYSSSSGTGTTVDLMGSAYIRNMDITLYLNPTLDETNAEAEPSLRDLVVDVVRSNEATFKSIKDRLGEDNEISVAVAIDNASMCPLLVLSVITDTDFMRDVVEDVLQEEVGLEAPDIVFSFGNVSKNMSTYSTVENEWELRETSASKNPEQMFAVLIGERDSRIPVSSLNELETISPMLYLLCRINARMASTVVSILDSLGQSGLINDDELNRNDFQWLEPRIVSQTFNQYIDAIGLSELVDSPASRTMIGARILAKSLYGESFENDDVPNESSKSTKMTEGSDVGIESVDNAPDESIPIPLPEETKSESNDSLTKTLKEPFVVDETMRLAAMYLMSPPTTSINFDLVSTHTIRCALAASSIVDWDRRPSVYDVLESIGFQYCKPLKNETVSNFTDFDLMESFKRVKVSRHTIQGGVKNYEQQNTEGTSLLHETYAQRYPMSVSEINRQHYRLTNVEPNGTIMEEYLLKQCEGKHSLVADKHMMDMLLNLEPADNTTSDDDLLFPFASIGHDDSNLADGYVTFFGTNVDTKECQKYSIMVKSNDFGPRPPELDFKSIGEDVDRLRSPKLDIGFGKHRLVCVASLGNKLKHRPRSIKRDFIGYQVDHSEWIGDFMRDLYQVRNKEKETTFGEYYDGDELNNPAEEAAE